MDFLEFAKSHGLIVSHIIDDDRVHRTPTDDKPGKHNGAYRFDGVTGFVQNWGQHTGPIRFSAEKVGQVDPELQRQREAKARKAQEDALAGYELAARRAKEMIRCAEFETHPYLTAKGFPDTNGLTISHDMASDQRFMSKRMREAFANEFGCKPDHRVLLIPMRHWQTNEIQSIQQVWRHGAKLYLRGGRAEGGVFSIGAQSASETWLCEGYATGLSISHVLHRLFKQARVIVCFSAANLVYVAKRLRGDVRVFADNDELKGPPDRQKRAGQAAAIETGRPWCMSPVEKEDANDMHQRAGTWAVMAAMKEACVR